MRQQPEAVIMSICVYTELRRRQLHPAPQDTALLPGINPVDLATRLGPHSTYSIYLSHMQWPACGTRGDRARQRDSWLAIPIPRTGSLVGQIPLQRRKAWMAWFMLKTIFTISTSRTLFPEARIIRWPCRRSLDRGIGMPEID